MFQLVPGSFICLLATALVATPAGATRPDQGRNDVAAKREILLEVTHVNVPSKSFKGARDISIWIPEGVEDSSTRYPVLVLGAVREFHTAIALAKAELLRTSHVVRKARERAVIAASDAHLRGLRKEASRVAN